MKSTIGNQIKLSLFGESHGDAIGVVIDGLTPGISIDMSFIQHQMELRKPKGNISTTRRESDHIQILSGVFNGKTCGTPLCICIKNSQQNSKDYEKSKDIMRPSHADYTANIKYYGNQDYRGGGHFSGRLTAPLVAAGAICIDMLRSKGIIIGSHILKIHDVSDESFSDNTEECLNQISKCNQEYFATINDTAKSHMTEVIEESRLNQDSVGGIIESAVIGCPAGIGEPYFNSVESTLSHLIFSLGGVKGIEFGLGFDFASSMGSKCNDSFEIIDGNVKSTTNNNGGINGGITNGMPLIIKTAIKPTPSISQTQDTINIATMENTQINIEGRHDPCIVHRVRIVIDSVIAIGLVDLIIERYGPQYFMEEQHD